MNRYSERLPLDVLMDRQAVFNVQPLACRIATATWIAAMTLAGTLAWGQPTNENFVEERRQFQQQELIPSRFGGWIFQVGAAPRIIWRDIDEIRRLGRDVLFRVRWFDTELQEAKIPNSEGRWLAWIEGTAPNGTPFRRSLTFFALPQKVENGFVPDLTVQLPMFPGPDSPPSWKEYQSEFDKLAREFLTRGLIDSEQGAILVAGISESRPRGRPVRFVESTGVVNDDYHLALKLKMLNLQRRVRTLQPPRACVPEAPMLHNGSSIEAGVPATAKQEIDDYCRKWVAATGEPFVTLVARNSVIITHEPFGNNSDGVPIDKNYRCWIASLTKSVTGMMFSQIVDQNLIKLDSSLSTVFSDFPADDLHVPTFRQCLNHTAGLDGVGEFGGMRNPQLENVVLNGIDVITPGKQYVYSGLGFELAAKAMEIVSGQSAVRLYHKQFFQPLGFGDVVMRNASSDGEFTAMELGILGQWLANRGSYGRLEFISPQTFEELLPKPLAVPGTPDHYGLGLQRIRHLKPGAPADSKQPEDQLFSTQTIGHGSFSGCIMMVDLEKQLVIVQVRRKFADADSAWWTRFFQTIAAATTPPTASPSSPDEAIE